MKKRPDWPACVEESNGRVVYRPRIKGEPPAGYGIDARGRLKPPIKIGMPTDSAEVILGAYLKAVQLLVDPQQLRKNSLFWIRDNYLRSRKFSTLSATSQKWYQQHIDNFLDYAIAIDRRAGKLGNLKLTQLSLPMINTIKDKLIARAKAKGDDGLVNVNGHIRATRAMLSWAVNNIDGLGVTYNPLKGITLETENRRDRYVTDEEYMEQYLFAVDHAPAYLPLVFEHAYLLACRSIEVCGLTPADILPEGYLVRRTKGSHHNVIAWTPRLEAARDAAMMFRGKFRGSDVPLIPSLWGNRLTKNTLQAAMQNLKKLMTAAGKNDICWNLHDLKRKGISDAKDSRIGGHRSDHIRERYMVKLKSFEPPA